MKQILALHLLVSPSEYSIKYIRSDTVSKMTITPGSVLSKMYLHPSLSMTNTAAKIPRAFVKANHVCDCVCDPARH